MRLLPKSYRAMLRGPKAWDGAVGDGEYTAVADLEEARIAELSQNTEMTTEYAAQDAEITTALYKSLVRVKLRHRIRYWRMRRRMSAEQRTLYDVCNRAVDMAYLFGEVTDDYFTMQAAACTDDPSCTCGRH